MKTQLTRRDFLRISGGATGLLATVGLFGGSLRPLVENKIERETTKWGSATATICPYCAVGCGFICQTDVFTIEGNLSNIEGDPDHPINHGSACSKGAGLFNLHHNDRRLSKILYRAPGGTEWQTISWDSALSKIAEKIKQTRDDSWIATDKEGYAVNRTEAIASLGGGVINNEECYLLVKMLRALGLVYIEHQARIGHASSNVGLRETFGQGAMTNHWTDIINADCIMIIGANPAENHPISFGQVTSARQRGAKLISVDPRFTRTSAKADIYAPLRSGTDVAFIGGMISYVIDDMEQNPSDYNMTYVKEYTNAPYLINPDFRGPVDLDGLFSGYNTGKRSYDKSTWTYQLDENGIPKKDKTLKDPNCVFQLLKRHFSRYDPDTVSGITGTPKDKFLEVCSAFSASGKAYKSGTIISAAGASQHTNGTQIIRSYAILQLLLGNIGVAGGGVNALRGESNVQGSSDHSLLFDVLPGYMEMPINEDETLEKYLKRVTPTTNDPKSANRWADYPKYMVSLLKTWYGDSATQANEFGYQYLPKNSDDYSWLPLFEAMYSGTIKGLMVWGQNPAVCSPNLNMTLEALGKLDWLVVTDLWETETATFWKRPGVSSTSIRTEVFLLPAVCSYEKEGSITNSGRWMQWRHKAVDGPGDSRPDLEIINDLMTRIRALYKAEGGPNAAAITDLTWDYGPDPDPKDVAKEVNGYDIATGLLLSSFDELKDDGTTTSGNWLYCGSFVEAGNMAARRNKESGPFNIGLYPGWAWCWPLNQRILYNRASVDLYGQPWNKEQPVIKWNPVTKKWKGDAPNGDWPPMAFEGTRYPFTMGIKGHASIFSAGLKNGPFPEHYEPWESPVENLLSDTRNDPTIKTLAGLINHQGSPDNYPIVCTTFRLGEHLGSGQISRNLPWLLELMPEPFMEISEALAAEKDISSGDKVTVKSARGQVTLLAMVTKRLRSLPVNGRTVHEVALPWHWGYAGLSTGDSANVLTPNIGDTNCNIPEYKAFLCNVEKAT